VNTAVVTGRSDFRAAGSGDEAGLQNLVRLMEDWTGRTLTMRGSFSSPWFSQYAVQPFGNGYFNPPTLQMGWDPIHSDFINWTPLTPVTFAVERQAWQEQ